MINRFIHITAFLTLTFHASAQLTNNDEKKELDFETLEDNWGQVKGGKGKFK